MPIDGVEKIATEFGLTTARVHQLVELGMPKESRGRYDVMKCYRWYVQYLRKCLEQKAAPMNDGSYSGERVERIRLLKANAELREMELAVKRGELLTVAEVE